MSCLNFIAIFNSEKVKGNVKFHQCTPDSIVKVIFNLYGMKPNTAFGCHVHEFGDTTKGCESLGGHLNLTNSDHGSIFININSSHTGDLLNNIFSDKDGKVQLSYDDPRLNMFGNINQSIIGTSVVIHDGVDDYGQGDNIESKKTGNAGGRMDCSIIGKAKSGPI